MYASVAQMEALRITHLFKSVSFVHELQLLNTITKPVDLGVHMSICSLHVPVHELFDVNMHDKNYSPCMFMLNAYLMKT